LHCPGHCPGNVGFYLASENLCFVGDVIFSGSVGRTDLPGGDFPALENSIKEKIYTLPDDTELAVGHGPNTTVGREKMSNPYVRC
jgi:hydroxyacylglutathione hydrolase